MYKQAIVNLLVSCVETLISCGLVVLNGKLLVVLYWSSLEMFIVLIMTFLNLERINILTYLVYM